MTQLERLEPRRLLAGDFPQGIQFADETMNDTHFTYAAAEAKKLGVNTVRVWIGIRNWDDRPDIDAPMPQPNAVDAAGNRKLDYARSLKGIFKLKELGFNVMVIFNPDGGAVPTADQVTGYFQHLLSIRQGEKTLADAIDLWELGNEPDLPGYWSESAGNKNNGLRSYVNKFLIPAATVLKSAGQQVVSAGPSYNPADLQTILTELQTQQKLDLIDYAGFHPYATFDPRTGANQQAINAAAAKTVADSFGKQMMATEWNIRGFGNAGANDAVWADALSQNYPSVILPNFEASYYFTNVNNWAARGGTTSARPGGVLKHDTTLQVTPSSDLDLLNDYYDSPLIPAEPFYSVYNSWQYGSVAGTVTTADATAGLRVFIDANANGLYDAGEYNALTDAAGAYAITYSVGTLKPGAYEVRVASPDAALSHPASVPVTLTALTSATADLDLTGYEPGATIDAPLRVIEQSSLSGVVWNDDDADGLLTDGEYDAGQQRVFVDLNDDGLWSEDEPATLSSAYSGAFTLTFDAALVGGPYAVRVDVPDGVAQTVVPTVELSLITQDVGYIGIQLDAPPALARGSISGVLFDDLDGDGAFTEGETPLVDRIVFIDANDNGVRDADEYAVKSNSVSGSFRFSRLYAGTYAVRLVPLDGQRFHPDQTHPVITIADGERIKDVPYGIVPPPAPADISGVVWMERDGDGIREPGENPAARAVVFIDANANDLFDADETSVLTEANGAFVFADLPFGTYRIGHVLRDGQSFATPSGGFHDVTLLGEDVGGLEFAVKLPAVNRVYMIGNSLTDGVRYPGLAAMLARSGDPVSYGRQTGSGFQQAANWRLQSGLSTSGVDAARPAVSNPWGNYQNAFAAGQWDYLTLQPHERRINSDVYNGFNEAEVPMSLSFMRSIAQNSPVAQTFIYSRPARRTDVLSNMTPTGNAFDYSTEWTRQYVDSGTGKNSFWYSRSYVTQLMPALRAAQAADPALGTLPQARLIPAGETYFQIDQQLKAGLYAGTSVASIFDLYADQSHPTDVSAYALALTVYSSLTGIDPRGVAPTTHYGTQAGKLADTRVQTLIQQAVYDAMTHAAYSGYVTPITTEPPAATITVRLYNDLDGDGTRDATDLPLSDVPVYLDLDRDGTHDAGEPGTLTDASGAAIFASHVGVHRVGIVKPDRFVGASSLDVIATGAGATVDTPMAGQGQLRVTIYNDANASGAVEAGEASQAGVTIFIDANSNGLLDAGERSAVTGADGVATIDQVLVGSRNVLMLAPAGFVITLAPPLPSAVVDGATTDLTGAVHNVSRPATISGVAFTDTDADGVHDAGEAPTAQARVFIDSNASGTLDADEQSTFTDAGGVYAFRDLLPGAYRIAYVLPAGMVFTKPSAGFVDVTLNGLNVTGIDFGTTLPAPPPPSVDADVTLQPRTAGCRAAPSRPPNTRASPARALPITRGRTPRWSSRSSGRPAGKAQLDFRYANGATNSRPVQVLVNGLAVGTFDAVPTGAWTTWQTLSLKGIALPAGAVTIQLLAHTGAGGPNVDSLAIRGESTTPPPVDPPPVDPPPVQGLILESESATRSGGSVPATSHAGFTGSGFVDYAGLGSAVEYALQRSSAGLATLTFRYANGSGAARPLQIFVNGVAVGTMAFAPTGSWSNWSTVSLSGITLPAGDVIIRAVASTSTGGANVDHLVIAGGVSTPTEPPPPPPPPPPSVTGSIAGRLFWDSNRNGLFDANEPAQAGKIAFLDLDGDNKLDGNEPRVTTDAAGAFRFEALPAGTYAVTRVLPSGFALTTGPAIVTLAAGEQAGDIFVGTNTA